MGDGHQNEDRRIGIIKTVQTPLGFFVLVVILIQNPFSCIG